jgi:FtsP/CotA-like multicopper oxidase with cupredoxin domain
MYRRQFLKSSALLAGSLALPSGLTLPARAATPRDLRISTRTLDINGKAATVFSLAEGGKVPGLTFAPGEHFSVNLTSEIAEPTIVHWHGLTPPFKQDGVGDNPLPMLAGGEARAFDFAIERPGTYWMHAHTLQEQNLLAAPLIVHSQEDKTADMQEVVLLLHDFSFTPASELLANLTGGKAAAHHSMDHGAMDMDAMDMGAMDQGSMNMEPMGGMDLNDIEYDAYLTNDRTLDDPEVIQVEKSGRVRLRIINAAASTAFTISTGTLSATLLAVDGQSVEPVTDRLFPLTMGQRIDLLLDIPGEGGAFPILALREGAAERTGIIFATKGATVTKLESTADNKGPVLDLMLESRLRSTSPLPSRKPDRQIMVHLTGDMATYRWGLMGAKELSAKPGERVEISIMNMSMMAHPMHLHGHHFQVTGIDGVTISGALRDTVLVPPGKTVRIAFDAGTAGRWPFHCHHLYHMESGMMGYMSVG